MSYQDLNVIRSKKAVAGILLGTELVGRNDYTVSGVSVGNLGVTYLVSGVIGKLSDGQIADYDLLLESIDGSDDQLCIAMDEVPYYFAEA